MLRIFNTMGRELQDFIPINDNKVLIYQCGPTVYWTQHIGNMRAMVMGDLIRRSLIYMGYDVQFTRNYTDVGHLTDDGDQGEDKMEKGVKREGITPQQIAQKYITQFENDTKSLGVMNPNHKPKATEFVTEMIKLTQELLHKGYAYSTDHAVYFDVSKFPEYTKLSGQKLEFQESGAGHGDVTDTDKRNHADFSLWFFKTGKHQNAIQTWESPFSSSVVENGEGFPGWHIECSAMARSTLADSIDIHLGGVEHIPVHHTNEIAQSEASSGKTFANYWMHYEHLMINGEKMSKSDGNILNLDDILARGYKPEAVRYFFLQSHYRSKQNFTWEALEASNTALSRLIARLSEFDDGGEVDTEAVKKFNEKLNDDFNVPGALAVVWDLLRDTQVQDSDKKATILNFDQVLGLNLEHLTTEVNQLTIPKEVQKLLHDREQARQDKDWQRSDELREQINTLGFEVKDSPTGQTLSKN